MSNNSTAPVLSQAVGVILSSNDAQYMILNAFRHALANRDRIEHNPITTFLCDRTAELDRDTKATIASEINAELQRDSVFTNADLERWLIVLKKLNDSLTKSNYN